MAQERRYRQRQEAILAVDYFSESQNPSLFYVTTDISQSGVFIKTPRPLDIGSRVELVFSLESSAETPDMEDRVLVQGVVTHVRTDGDDAGMGIRFENLAADDWRRLQSFIAKRGRGRAGAPVTDEMRLHLQTIEARTHKLQQDLGDLTKKQLS